MNGEQKMYELASAIADLLIEKFGDNANIIDVQTALTGAYLKIMVSICEALGNMSNIDARRIVCRMLNDLTKTMLDNDKPKETIADT